MTWRLLHVTLENFKSYKHAHTIGIDRDPGLYYVMGINETEPALEANGAGKSTIWDAVVWAVTGRTIRAARPGASVCARGVSGRTRVELAFEGPDGQTYRILRQRKPNRLALIHGDLDRDVEQPEVERVFGMDTDLLLRTVIMGQFGTLFLDLPPEKQSALLTEALDLNRWLDAAARAADLANKVERERETVLRDLSRAEGRLEELDRQVRQLRKDVTASERLQEQRIRDHTEKVQEAQKAWDSSAKRLLRAKQTMEEAEAALARARERSAPAIAEARALERQLADLEAQIRGKGMGTLQGLDRRLLEYAQARKARTCPECGQTVTVKHLDAKVDALKDDRDQVRKDIDRLEDKVAVVRKQQREHNKELVALDAKEHALIGEHTAAVEVLALAKATAKLDKQRIDNLKEELEQLKRHEVDAKQQLRAAKTFQHDVTETVEGLRADRNKLERQQQAALYWAKAFKEIRLQQLDEALLELEVAVNSHAEGLGLHGWLMRFATERETKSGSVSYGLSVTILPPDEEEPAPWETYSGGESQRWHLAVTMGLSDVLLARAGIEPNAEVLDEPTQHLTQQGIEDLIEHLHERAHELGRCIYLVDHRALDRGSFDGMLVVTKDKQGSHVTVK